MRNYNPQADYVVLLWCRHCGHCATQPVEPALALESVRSRARCGRCGKKWIGAVQMYEPRLGIALGLLTSELKLIARAVSTAAGEERKAGNAIAYGSDSGRRERHFSTAAIYERLAAKLVQEAESRQKPALPEGEIAE